MDFKKFLKPDISSTAGIVTLGAATGAVAGAAGLLAYGMLAGKGAAVALAGKSATLQSGFSWLGLLAPASAGAVGGGASSLGISRKVMLKQVNESDGKTDEKADALRIQVQELESQLHSEEIAIKELHAQLKTEETAIKELEAQLKAEEAAAREIGVKHIKGIGPKFAQLLCDADIRTINHLAQASPEQILQALESSATRQMANPEDWIHQAKELLQYDHCA